MKDEITNISYKVQDAHKYFSLSKNNLIEKINQKSQTFIFQTNENQFKIILKLTSPALVTGIETKIEEADMLNFQFYNSGEITEDLLLPIEKQNKPATKGKTIIRKIQKISIVDRIQLTIINKQPRRSIIHFVLLKGIKDEKNNNRRNMKSNNFSEKDLIVGSHQKKKSKEEKFDFHQRQTTTKKTSPADLVKEVISENKYPTLELEVEDDDSQLKKAIQKSKKQQKMAQQQRKRKEKERNQEKQEQQFYDYRTQELNQHLKKVYEHVNLKWLQAQRMAEKKNSVMNKHSITTYISPKCFKTLKYWINNQCCYADKKNIMKMIVELGGKVIQQPVNHCYIIGNQMKKPKIVESKKLQGCKYVTPNFIEDCHQQKRLMKYNDYKPDA